jgi:hypothetical protein
MTDRDDPPNYAAPTPSRLFWTLTVIGILAMLALCVVLTLVASRA